MRIGNFRGRTTASRGGCSSVVGAVILGVILFFASFIVLFINEGRENLGKVAEDAQAYNPSIVYTEEDLVYVVGTISSTQPVTDNYLLDNNYIFLIRSVEMYTYIERERKDDDDRTIYEYDLEWTSNPQKPQTFGGRGHEIPPDIPQDLPQWIDQMPTEERLLADDLSIDGVPLSTRNLSLSNAHSLSLTNDLVDASALAANESVVNNVIFRQNSDNGTISSPNVGDVKIAYDAVTEDDTGILLSGVTNGTFTPFTTPGDNTLFRFFNASETQQEAIDILTTEYTVMLWIIRLVGFLMMFGGLLFIGKPLQAIAHVLPLLSRIGYFIYGVLAFAVALVLTILTILISMIFHNIFLLIGVLVLIAAFIFYRIKKKQTETAELDKEAHAR